MVVTPLNAAQADLDALIQALLAAGDQSEPLGRLCLLVSNLPHLLAGSAPPDDEIRTHWRGIVTALRDWLGLPAESANEVSGRDDFWK